MRKVFHIVLVLILAGAVLALDQLTKAWVREALPFGASWAPWADRIPWLRIVHWSNRGAAFGMFQEGGALFAALAVIVVVLVLAYLPKMAQDPWLMRLGVALILGGALGNLVDRLTQGVVTDFIAVGQFPVFNLADASITLGALALFLAGWHHPPEPEPSPEIQPQEAPGGQDE